MLDMQLMMPPRRRIVRKRGLSIRNHSLSIKQNAPVRHQLIQKVEVRDIASYDRPAEFSPLEKDECVVETFAFCPWSVGP